MSLASLIARRMLGKKVPSREPNPGQPVRKAVARPAGLTGTKRCAECGCAADNASGHYPGCSRYITRAERKVDAAPFARVQLVSSIAGPEAPVAEPTPTRWAGQCEAINADDARRCGLLKGHDAVDPADEAAVLACSPANRDLKRFELAQRRWHRSARGPFTRCAQPGQTFPDRERLDQLAQARGAPHDEHGKTRTGKELERPKHYRKRAHAGDDTTTGLERPITQESA